MNPSRHRLIRMLICLAALLAVVAAVNLIVNPYGAWPFAVIDRTYLRMPLGVERLATPYRIRTEAPTLLLVGTSRMLYGVWIEQGYREGVLNAALAGASLAENAALIELALRHPELRHIVWSVDFVTFSEEYRGFRDQGTQARLAGDAPLQLRETLLSMDALRASGRVLLRAAGGRDRLPRDRLLPIPWSPQTLRTAFDEIGTDNANGAADTALDRHVTEWLAIYAQHRRSQELRELYQHTVARVRDAGIELTLLVPPMSGYELETIRQSGAWTEFQNWKRELAAIHPYRDFSGYNAAAAHDAFYTLPIFCHFKVPVGHAVLRRVLGEDCGDCGPLAQTVAAAGVLVDATTIEAHLAEQDAALRRFNTAQPQYARRVEHLRSPQQLAAPQPSAINPEGELIPMP